MKVELKATACAVVAGVMLGACASKGAVNPGSADENAQDETAAEYRRLAENAGQRRVCKRQAVLGTRVDSIVCVTEAEMKAQREHATDVIRDIQANEQMTRPGTPDRNPPPPPPSSPPRQ
jgi:hypothetical protein